MTNTELINLINSKSSEKITEVESIDSKKESNAVYVVGIAGVKRLEFKLTTNGDFSYRYLGIKLKKL